MCRITHICAEVTTALFQCIEAFSVHKVKNKTKFKKAQQLQSFKTSPSSQEDLIGSSDISLKIVELCAVGMVFKTENVDISFIL